MTQKVFVDTPDYFKKFATIEEHDTFFLNELTRLKVFNENIKTVLSIGSGEGVMELGIATQWPQLTLVACLDASPTYTEALEKEAKSKGLKNISAICKTFEAYESDTKFDLIVAVHAWYAFGENKEILEKAKSLLAPGGRIAIVIQEHESIAHALTAFNASVDFENITSTPFSQWLNKNGYPNTHQLLSHWVPYERFISPSGEITQDGIDYSSFLAFQPYATLADEKKEGVKRTFKEKSVNGQIDLACGLILVQSSN